MKELGPALFYLPLLIVVGYFVYRALKFGGLKGAMFGARIEKSLGEVDAERQGPVGTAAVKVHVLRRGMNEKLVGLEFVAKSFGGYQMTPVAMQESQARQLLALLQEALNET